VNSSPFSQVQGQANPPGPGRASRLQANLGVLQIDPGLFFQGATLLDPGMEWNAMITKIYCYY
jgi:hypothetical protein